MTQPPVRLQGLRKTYNEGLPNAEEVLHGIDLEIAHGEFTALIGPSGSGKSTLLNALGLLETASGGCYELAGRDVTQFDDERMRARHLLPAFTALEIVMLPGLMRPSGRDGAEAIRRRAAELLAALGLADAMDKKPQQLSGGMQQRVAIARALVLGPRLAARCDRIVRLVDGLIAADEPNLGPG